MTHPWLQCFWVCVVLVLFAPFGSRGNEVTVEYDPSVAGQLVPRTETAIEVVKENIDIRFSKVDFHKSIVA